MYRCKIVSSAVVNSSVEVWDRSPDNEIGNDGVAVVIVLILFSSDLDRMMQFATNMLHKRCQHESAETPCQSSFQSVLV